MTYFLIVVKTIERSSLHCHFSWIFCVFSISQDLKDPRRRDEMAAARADLRKHSAMLFTSSKVSKLGGKEDGEGECEKYKSLLGS